MRVDKTLLKYMIEQGFKAHVEEDKGLIAGQDKLLNRTVEVVGKWLKFHEAQYRTADCSEVADALRDLRMNLMR